MLTRRWLVSKFGLIAAGLTALFHGNESNADAVSNKEFNDIVVCYVGDQIEVRIFEGLLCVRKRELLHPLPPPDVKFGESDDTWELVSACCWWPGTHTRYEYKEKGSADCTKLFTVDVPIPPPGRSKILVRVNGEEQSVQVSSTLWQQLYLDENGRVALRNLVIK